ncbi:protein SENSITIVE TO UV 2-like [Bidens hawaiensis]|uniref:protein SENSITIVE TO UV 2-like n=1 Tax=Bidens hawaiensis TaxID=980011 RepID=UPI0040491346
MAKMKRNGDIGSLWRIPLAYLNSKVCEPLNKMEDQAEDITPFIHLLHFVDELGRLSKVLANLEQECSQLRENNQSHLKPVLPLNNSTLKYKDPPIQDPSLGPKGVIPCKAVGVQTDGHAVSTDTTIKKNSSVSRKLVGIWEPQNDQIPRTNLVSKLFVACEADLQVLFGFLGLNIPSKKTTTKVVPSNCIQSSEAAKVSHLYLTLTKIGYDSGKLGDLLEALVDLCGLQNVMIVYRSLCVLHVVLKHILNMENNLSCRDTVIINDPSTSNPRLLTGAKNKGNSRNESQPLISSFKWFSLFQTMHEVATRQCEESIKVEAVSIMNILLLRTDAYTERAMYGEVSIFQSLSQLLKKEAGVDVKKEAVHLLYLLLNCPKLLVMFCSSSNEEGTSGEVSRNGHTFEGLGSVLDGLADCLACHRNGAFTNSVLKLQRNTIILLAFLASSGRSGFEILLGRNLSRRTNFLYLILQVMASEIDTETSECIQLPEDI